MDIATTFPTNSDYDNMKKDYGTSKKDGDETIIEFKNGVRFEYSSPERYEVFQVPGTGLTNNEIITVVRDNSSAIDKIKQKLAGPGILTALTGTDSEEHPDYFDVYADGVAVFGEKGLDVIQYNGNGGSVSEYNGSQIILKGDGNGANVRIFPGLSKTENLFIYGNGNSYMGEKYAQIHGKDNKNLNK